MLVVVNYLISRSDKKWIKQTSDKRSNLLEKIRSTELVPPSEFQDYFGKTLSGKITYDGNNLIIAPHTFRFGTLLFLGLFLVLRFFNLSILVG
ncbi:MAG: hypothetical protein SRB2_03838 [Desulfobacteraceae bacterium Eth-SRB2]|nr:MAG: hypothetical protein SRB2_03838 [Desulfobacteraceae bacterium Eth-SRB2]